MRTFSALLSVLLLMFVTLSPAPAWAKKAKRRPHPVASPSAAPAAQAESSEDSVWVARPDGGKQCAPDSAQSMDSTAAELLKAGVKPLEGKKASDGRMHMQLCGTASGQENAFRIPKSQLKAAVGIGFHPMDSGTK